MAAASGRYTHADSPAWDFFSERWEASEYTEIAEAENSYAMQFYGLLIVTALAYGSAGTTDAAQSAEHVRTVSMAPGKTVHT